jgi:flagellar basal body-associated protein FliL
MTTIIILICTMLLVVGVAIVAMSSKRSGQDGEKLKQAEKTIDAINKGQAAIDRARNDPDLAQRLRDKYKPK